MTNNKDQRHYALFLFDPNQAISTGADTVEFYTGTIHNCIIIAKALQSRYTVMVVDYTEDVGLDEHTKHTVDELEAMWKRS